ncbi:MAG: hypothetical protein PHV18_15425 [Lachnospiraceae bacterium]|nr:hypothetical protein [Lachnospiraceae bacterium]
MDNLKEALQYAAELKVAAEPTEVLEICGKTYARRDLVRYGKPEKADALHVSSLSALVDYIEHCSEEFPGKMVIHIMSPTKVRFMSALDDERGREVLIISDAETSEFEFDKWYDQERMMIDLQANFVENEDLKILLKAVGNIEKKNNATFSDDGVSQVATATIGLAQKADILVPNPVELIPYRTFQEVEQPASKFVFRIGDKEVPAFKLVEAEGGIWKNEAIENIKQYFFATMSEMPQEIQSRIVVIG